MHISANTALLPSLASIDKSLPRLNYPFDALRPFMSKDLLKSHYHHHHAPHTRQLDSPDTPDMGIVDAITFRLEWIHRRLLNLRTATMHSGGARALAIRLCDIRKHIRLHGGGHVNHCLFWRWLRSRSEPQHEVNGPMVDALRFSFGSLEGFRDSFVSKALSVEGDGWVWLVIRPDRSLAVTTTSGEDNPLMRFVVPEHERGIPVFGMDLAAHAYEIQYGTDRQRYLAACWNFVNWRQVGVDFDAFSRDLSWLTEPPHDPLWGGNPTPEAVASRD